MPADPARDKRCAIKNAVFVALIIFSNTFGNALLAMSMSQMPDIASVTFTSYAANVLTNQWFLTGTFLSAFSMFATLTMYTWADLSYILPVTASGYVLTALFGKFLLHENIGMLRWIGVVIISFGVFFVAHTPPDTKHMEPAPEDIKHLEEAQK